MHSWQALPEAVLHSVGPISTALIDRGAANFRTAGRYLHQLPYGRNTNRADFRLVLTEGRGTCSTKHALLAELARERHLSVVLTLGIYEMHERNTLGVGPVLDKYELSYLPEAHCYLTYEGMRIDVTRSGMGPTEPIRQFLHEEAITPEQIGNYKIRLHQQFLRQWVTNTALTHRLSFEEIWRIREECITELTQ
ncbi:MAG: hypothetical protein AB7P69_21925 [Candidatus Binatia bacterium]